MSRKRISLDTLFTKEVHIAAPPQDAPEPAAVAREAARGDGPGHRHPAADHHPDPAPEKPRRPYEERHTKQSFYMTEPVYEQLRRLAFDEKRKMQHYLREGLDRVFRDRGLPSIAELEKHLEKEGA